jgi:hypothetical protein
MIIQLQAAEEQVQSAEIINLIHKAQDLKQYQDLEE